MSERASTGKMLWVTWVALMLLLGLTWLFSRFDLGVANTLIALAISGAKMLLVIFVFMQVRFHSKSVWIFACAGFVWWLIFISLAMTDYLTRPIVVPYQNISSHSQNANPSDPVSQNAAKFHP